MLTTFGRSVYYNNIYLNIKNLTPARYSQYIPAKGGLGTGFSTLGHSDIKTTIHYLARLDIERTFEINSKLL
jgi:hypothetical protein